MNLLLQNEGARGQDYREAVAPAAEPARLRASSPVYAFVPAHGDSQAGAVQERLGRTWAEGLGLAVLLVDFVPPGDDDRDESTHRAIRHDGSVDRSVLAQTGSRAEVRAMKKLISRAGSRYDVICVNLTDAPESAAAAILDLAHSVFLVSDSERASLELARAAVERLRRLKLEDRLALLLRRTPGGLRPDLAEDVAGAPVCGLVETTEQLARLARWLALPQPQLAQAV